VDVKGRFTTSDVVRRLVNIVARTYEDRIVLALSLETLARQTVTVKQQVTS
jgi:hypothetical protein